MLSKGHTLFAGDVESFGEFFYPIIGLGLGFRVIAIEDNDNALGFFHDSWPHSVVFDVAYLSQFIPETSQNSMETNLLST